MNAQLLLAEAAVAHPDGTVSMLRAGITHLWAAEPPWALVGILVIRISADMTDQGPHQFELLCMDEDGARGGLPPLRGGFDVPQAGASTNMLLGLDLKFQKPGRYVFALRVDNVPRGELVITAATKKGAITK